MVSLKTFHQFFIFISIIISGYYGYYEITMPSSAGIISYILSGSSFLLTLTMIAYAISVRKKFKEI
tara:strand:+ start:436 stop:633 length:198 start_codon:yes stop_codon:yes gene_type:complete